MKNLEFNERHKFIDSRSTAYYKKEKLQENHVQTHNQTAESQNKEKKILKASREKFSYIQENLHNW